MTKFESVLTQALELEGDELEMLAERIETSLRERKSAYDEAWSAEIKRRVEEVDRGEGDLMDWDEFRKELMAGQ